MVGAQLVPGAGLAILRRQGMAAWIKTSYSIAGPYAHLSLPLVGRQPRARSRGTNSLSCVVTIEVVTVEPTSGTKRKAKAKSKVVAAAPAVPVKSKPGHPRKATA